MASSRLRYGEVVIDDANMERAHLVPEGFGRGLDYASRTAEGYGTAAEPFPASLIIPKSEWQARIQEAEERKTRLSDIITQSGLPPKNQQQTNYCWVNSPTHCIEINRVVQNEPMVILSPASAGAQIKGYRNVGGWGREALEWIGDNGLVPVDRWPANSIDRQYATPQNKQLALHYRQAKWWVLDGSLEQMVSLLLRRIPGSAGLSWWSHQVTYIDPVWLDGDIAIRFRNSWGPDWPKDGAGGWSVLQGRRMYADDLTAPVTALAG